MASSYMEAIRASAETALAEAKARGVDLAADERRDLRQELAMHFEKPPSTELTLAAGVDALWGRPLLPNDVVDGGALVTSALKPNAGLPVLTTLPLPASTRSAATFVCVGVEWAIGIVAVSDADAQQQQHGDAGAAAAAAAGGGGGGGGGGGSGGSGGTAHARGGAAAELGECFADDPRVPCRLLPYYEAAPGNDRVRGVVLESAHAKDASIRSRRDSESDRNGTSRTQLQHIDLAQAFGMTSFRELSEGLFGAPGGAVVVDLRVDPLSGEVAVRVRAARPGEFEVDTIPVFDVHLPLTWPSTCLRRTPDACRAAALERAGAISEAELHRVAVLHDADPDGMADEEEEERESGDDDDDHDDDEGDAGSKQETSRAAGAAQAAPELTAQERALARVEAWSKWITFPKPLSLTEGEHLFPFVAVGAHGGVRLIRTSVASMRKSANKR